MSKSDDDDGEEMESGEEIESNSKVSKASENLNA
jgi:hypothetical protein